jgi:RimJ/RimL family protein N-acetyltransferase
VTIAELLALRYDLAMIEVTLEQKSFKPALPIFEMVHLGTLTRDGEVFAIHVGLDELLVAQLKVYSLDESDEDIQRNTSDRERFGVGSYEEWYAKSRTPFALVHAATGQLAALVWYGPKGLGKKSLKHLTEAERASEHSVDQGDWHTIVYRAYKPFRGGGIMRPFVQATLELYRAVHPGIHLWAGIHTENPASLALCERLGFVLDTAHTDAVSHHYVLTLT